MIINLETIRREIKEEWAKGKPVWSEDECTKGHPGHETIRRAVTRLYGDDTEWLIKVEFGDHWIELHETHNKQKMFLVCIACDGEDIREIQ